MIRTVLTVAAVVLGVSVAVAQQDPIKARKTLMKANGDQAKIGAAMIKGEKPFDLDKVHRDFRNLRGCGGEDAEAVPGQLQDRRGYRRQARRSGTTWTISRRRFAKFGRRCKAAQDASVKDLDIFKAAIGNIGKNDCGSCHRTIPCQEELSVIA